MSRTAQPGSLIGPLSLTPLLGATDSLMRVLGLLALLWVIGGVHLVLGRLLRPLLGPSMQLLASAWLAALLVSCAELVLQAHALALYQGLGIYLALIGAHCVLNARQREQTDNYPAVVCLFSALMLLLGLLRELLGNGTLFNHAQWLFGTVAAHWEIQVFSQGWHLALLVPGGFVLLGLLLAARNAWILRTDPARLSGTDTLPSSSAPKEPLHP